MNWIEQKISRERALQNGAPALWHELRAAVQDACESYNQHYAASSPEKRVTCQLENGKRLRLEKKLRFQAAGGQVYRQDRLSVVVSLELDPEAGIKVAGDEPVKAQVFSISSTEERAFIGTDANQLDVEEVSRRILEPLLFPSGQYSDPY